MIILRSKSFAADPLDALAELPNGQEEIRRLLESERPIQPPMPPDKFRHFDNKNNNFKAQTVDKQKGILITLKDKINLKFNEEQLKNLKKCGKGAVVTGGMVAAGLGAKKVVDKKKAKKKKK